MLSLKKHGDEIERLYYDSVIPEFCTYEELWKIYIGNNGKAQIPFKDEGGKTRTLISQCSYTIYESIVCLFMIKKKGEPIGGVKDYLDANNDFILYQTHIGRVRDCVNKIGISLKLHQLVNRLNDFYTQRNNVLHGIKLPFTIIEDYLVLPKVEGSEMNSKLWSDKLSWEDFKRLENNKVSDIYETFYHSLISNLNGIYSEIIETIKRNPDNETLIKKMREYEPEYKHEIGVSGFQENHCSAERFLQSISGSVIQSST